MNCYYHPNQPAVGLCKHCQRGVCIACAADVDGSLACKERHEEQVRALDSFDNAQPAASREGWLSLSPQCHLLFSGRNPVCRVRTAPGALAGLAGGISAGDRHFLALRCHHKLSGKPEIQVERNSRIEPPRSPGNFVNCIANLAS